MNNEIKINVPEGMEIDKEHSTFECIKLKPKSKWLPKRGDIVCTDGPYQQIMLVKEFIREAFPEGFHIESLAILVPYRNYFAVRNNPINEYSMWAVREASALEKKLFIEKLNEQGYVYNPNDPRVIYKIERKLPKTWEEFCIKNPINQREYFIKTDSTLSPMNPSYRDSITDANMLPSREYAKAMLALCKLIQLRDCYNGDWKPDWSQRDWKYVLYFYQDRIVDQTTCYGNTVLSFKTAYLRDTFYKNFKDLIEEAKLLL